MRFFSARLHHNAKDLRCNAVVWLLLSAQRTSVKNANNIECVIVELRRFSGREKASIVSTLHAKLQGSPKAFVAYNVLWLDECRYQ